MQRMGKAWIIAAGLVAAASVAACSSGSSDSASSATASSSSVPSGVMEWELLRGEATVQSVDPERRLAVLRNAAGKTLTLKVGPNVDLAKVHPGDQVAMAFYEAVAIDVSRPGTASPSASAASAVIPAERGQIPAGAIVEQVTVTAAVAEVDPAANTVTFRGPEGNLRVVKVKNPQLQQQLGSLQVGDMVQVTFTEGVAMQVVPQGA